MFTFVNGRSIMACRFGLNREKYQSYFELLERILMENELFD